MTGQILSTGIKDVAVRAPDGSLGQIDTVRHDQLRQHGGIAPGFDNMQAPAPANEIVNQNPNGGRDNARDESERDYGPAGQREADVGHKEVDQKDKDQADDVDEYPEDKDAEANAQRPVEVRTCCIIHVFT